MRSYYKKKSKRKYFFLAAMLTLAAFLGWFGWTAWALVQHLPSPEQLTRRAVAQSTKIYDRTGKIILYEIHGEEKRTIVDLEQIPQHVIDATLAAEDIHFYEHRGLDFRGIARAFWINLLRGEVSQGGSTITQQLTKKALLTDERTLTRKIREAMLALLIERTYEKNEILELYLNQIPYGSNAYGIASAAQTYFGKDAPELSIAQGALLASIPKATTYYSPYGSHREELTARKDWIIDRMADARFITAQEATEAKKEEFTFLPPQKTIRAPHFVMYVRQHLDQTYGEEFVEAGGLTVITTLDTKLQEAAEQAVKEGAKRNEEAVGARNAALVALDPRTGEILAMVGSRDYFDIENDGNVNVSTRPRQPGSAFKPFVYAAAFKKGYTPDTVLFDVPTEFNVNCNSDGSPGPNISNPKDCYHPSNYDNTFRGPVTLRQSIAQSLNLPSVKLLYLAGLRDTIETARAMGISTLGDPARYGLTLVLGGGEVTLLEMTSGFGVFANDGVLSPKTAILRVQTADGRILEEKKESAMPALDPEVTRTINNVLSDNNARIPMFQPRSSLFFEDRDVAAKTGTTQDYRDAWTVGYTPTLTAGVWVGNNDNTPFNQAGLSVLVAAPIWRAFMDAALASTPPTPFIPPDKSLWTEKPTLRGEFQTGEPVLIDSVSKKLANEHTPPELVTEKRFGNASTILGLIDKDAPLGPAPENPAQDPQYTNWQAAINAWLALHPIAMDSPPREYDDVHTPESKPKLAVPFLTEPKAIPPSTVEIPLETQSRFPLREIQLFIDEVLLSSKTAPIPSGPVTLPLPAPVEKGIHRIKIIAYDIVGNNAMMEKDILVAD